MHGAEVGCPETPGMSGNGWHVSPGASGGTESETGWRMERQVRACEVLFQRFSTLRVSLWGSGVHSEFKKNVELENSSFVPVASIPPRALWQDGLKYVCRLVLKWAALLPLTSAAVTHTPSKNNADKGCYHMPPLHPSSLRANQSKSNWCHSQRTQPDCQAQPCEPEIKPPRCIKTYRTFTAVQPRGGRRGFINNHLDKTEASKIRGNSPSPGGHIETILPSSVN